MKTEKTPGNIENVKIEKEQSLPATETQKDLNDKIAGIFNFLRSGFGNLRNDMARQLPAMDRKPGATSQDIEETRAEMADLGQELDQQLPAALAELQELGTLEISQENFGDTIDDTPETATADPQLADRQGDVLETGPESEPVEKSEINAEGEIQEKETWEMSVEEFLDSAQKGSIPHRDSNGRIATEFSELNDVVKGKKPLASIMVGSREQRLVENYQGFGAVKLRVVNPNRSILEKLIAPKEILVLPANLSDEEADMAAAKYQQVVTDKKRNGSEPFTHFLMGKILGYNTEDINAFLLNQHNNGTYPKKKYPNIESLIKNIADNAHQLPDLIPKIGQDKESPENTGDNTQG